MSKQTISVVKKTVATSKNGDAYLKVKTETENFSCFIKELFAEIPESGQVEVEVQVKGEYKNIVGAGGKLPDAKASTYFKPSSNPTMKKDIEEAQLRKNDAIKEAGAQRDSVLIVTTFYPELSTAHNKDVLIQQKLEQWKSYFS